MAAELDGPRLEPRGGQAQAAGGVPARLWRRRQRPDRHRPRLAGAAAGHRVRLAARARAVRPGADRPAMVRAHLPRSERALGRRATRPRPVLERFLDAELARRKLPPSALALVGFSQGTMMALHVGLAPRRPRRRPSSAIPACSCCRTTAEPEAVAARDQVAAAGAAGPRRPGRPDPGAGAVPGRAGAGGAGRAGRMAHVAGRRPRHRPGGPAPRRRVPGAAIRPAQLKAGIRRRRPIRAQPRLRALHNPVMLPIDYGEPPLRRAASRLRRSLA